MPAASAEAVTPLIRRALVHHQAGRIGAAAQIYDEILLIEPAHAQALHYAGLAAHQQEDTGRAILLMQRSLESEPDNATFHLNLGQVFQTSGDFPSASEHYRKAIASDPSIVAAHQFLGNVLLELGYLDEAASAYASALKLAPDSPEIINSLGTLLRQAGRTAQACTFFQKALALNPLYAEAHNNLGLAQLDLGDLDQAVASCRMALDCNPDLAEAHCNLGNMLRLQGDITTAISSCRTAIALQPGLIDAHLNLGNALRTQGLLREAVDSYKRAIRFQPTHTGALNNLAETLKDQGNIRCAVAAFEQALALEPHSAAIRSNLLYLHAFTRDITHAEERALAQQWERNALSDAERRAARERASVAAGAFSAQPRSGRRLRLGIVSAELGSHAVAEFLEPVLEQLDRSRFHLTLFPTTTRSCARADHFRALADAFIPLLGSTDEQAADFIRTQQIDVLIDTSGHTFGNRLGIFARRAAPVQCSYIGYWSTTGLTEMDWFFGDPYCGPAIDIHFTEGIWRLPRIAVAYRGDVSLPKPQWKPDHSGTIWLGSFNKFGKIREQTIHLWAQCLHALPEAKLLLEDAAVCEGETHERIHTLLAAEGIGRDRVEFIPYIRGHERHMQLYDRLDIALDTIPFNSGTTAFDALWMGVPLVALAGEGIGAQMGTSLLREFGHPEWIAQTESEYAAIVCSLARNVEHRSALRNTQRARMSASPLCDAVAMARALEYAFEAMYDRWLKGEPAPNT